MHTSLFDINLQPILGFPGRVIDAVQFVNSVVIVTLLILAVPLYFVVRDARAVLVRYGVGRGERLDLEKDAQYVAAAETDICRGSVSRPVRVRTHPYPVPARSRRTLRHQHRHLAKRLEYVPVRVGHLPGVYVPSYQLNYFELAEADGRIRVRYRILPKAVPNDLTLLERLLILGRRIKPLPPIPAETFVGQASRAGFLQ